MKKFVLAFILFIIFIFVLAILIGREDDNAYYENTEDDVYIEQFVENTSSASETEEDQVSLQKRQNHDTVDDLTLPSSSKSGHAEQIIQRVAYTVSYNNTTKCPNWVSWCLTAEHTDGPYSRKGVPYCDEDRHTAYGIGAIDNNNNKGDYFLDTDFAGPRQEFSDWRDKTYNVNHGHICPAGDNKWSKEAMNQSFYLSNMCPQDIDLNGGDWENLEKKCRRWAKKYGAIYIVAGPVFYNDTYRTMGDGKVGIPDAFFKVILCLNQGQKAIGFLFPNKGDSHELIHYIKTVDEIEEITGYDFFSSLPNDVENVLESTCDWGEW